MYINALMFNPALNAMSLRFALLPFLFAPIVSQSAVVVFAEYRLGEAGSLGANNLPQDSSGNGLNFTGFQNSGSSSVISGGASSAAGVGGVAGGSTAYLSTANAANDAYYSNGLYTGVAPTDNFAFGIFAKAAQNTTAERGLVFGMGDANGSYSIALSTNGWSAGATNLAWIGEANGVTGSFAADTWVHLALIRSNGVTTFYINGVAQSGTTTLAPVHGTAYLSTTQGGNTCFDGGLDEARVVTFDAGESTANVIAALQTGVSAVPEPSAYGLLGAGALAAAALVRRRRR